MVSVIRGVAKNRVVLVNHFFTIPSKQYEEMKKYAAENPITNEDSDEEVMKYLKENVSTDFFEKILSMAKKKNSK
jgi:arginine utilization protein RocB